jgi:outer membrane biosynthesis protein TonB
MGDLKAWVLRHKVASIILALFVLGVIGAATGGNKPATTQVNTPTPPTLPTYSTQETPSTPPPATEAAPTTQTVTSEPTPAPSPAPLPSEQAVPPPATVAPPANSEAAVYYQNCDAARAAGAAPLYAGQPGYRSALDRDGDGVACE